MIFKIIESDRINRPLNLDHGVKVIAIEKEKEMKLRTAPYIEAHFYHRSHNVSSSSVLFSSKKKKKFSYYPLTERVREKEEKCVYMNIQFSFFFFVHSFSRFSGDNHTETRSIRQWRLLTFLNPLSREDWRLWSRNQFGCSETGFCHKLIITRTAASFQPLQALQFLIRLSIQFTANFHEIDSSNEFLVPS